MGEKMRPIDEKLRYRVEKILSQKKEEESKPNLEDMMTSITDDEPEEEVEDEKPGVYKAPKFSPVEYTGDHLVHMDKAQKQLDRQAERMRKSQMVQDLRQEFTDAPTEIRSEALQDKELRAIEKKLNHRTEFEEENMMRVGLSKKDRRDMRKLENSKFKAGRSEGIMSLQDLSDVGNVGMKALSGFKDAQEKVRQARDVWTKPAARRRSAGSTSKASSHGVVSSK